jgi:SAM-dependent methyltransferase
VVLNSYGYDEEVNEHYNRVAKEHGGASTSTMEDVAIRRKETDAILTVLSGFGANREVAVGELAVLDVGCGNAFTLSVLAEMNPGSRLTGLEINEALRDVANRGGGVEVVEGDIRDAASLPSDDFQVIICQRVLINILDPDHQLQALHNLINFASKGTLIVFIECFESGLQRLNQARAEFDLTPIPPALHNLYLPDGFFETQSLRSIDLGVNPDFLSTQYYVSRVLHDVLLESSGSKFSRNSDFVSFISGAIPQSIGAFSPLRLLSFIKQ